MFLNTPNTTRLPGADPESCSLMVTQLLYPFPGEEGPNAVILVTGRDGRLAMPAASLVHDPINAPIIVCGGPFLTQAVFEEVLRLRPSGKRAPAQILLVGPFHPAMVTQLRQTGFSVLHFDGHDPIVQSIHVAEWRTQCLPQQMPELISHHAFLISFDDIESALPVLGWSAHRGTPLLFTYRDRLPEVTKRFLQKEPHRSLTLFGSANLLDERVEQACREIVQGTVERVEGASPADLAVSLARRKSEATGIGWGRNTPGRGDAFTFLPPRWEFALGSAPMSHRGKHTPQMPLTGGMIPSAYVDYLKDLRLRGPHPEPPFMHAYICGGTEWVPFLVQRDLESCIR